MWLKLSQIRQPIDDRGSLLDLVVNMLALPAAGIKDLEIIRKSLDARHKDLDFVYTVIFDLDITPAESGPLLNRIPNLVISEPPRPAGFIQTKIPRAKRSPNRIVIVGTGPAGLFAGFKLAVAGFQPIIIDRGDGLTDRIAKVDLFWKTGRLDPESNIQYGIGGAGTFSDGKLTTRIKDAELNHILQIMVTLGAPPDILYWQHPHIGTDLLRNVVRNLEQRIEEYGGEFRFRNRLTDIYWTDSKLHSIESNGQTILETDRLILATGNSARDIYQLLFLKGFKLEAKPFAVGLRIEHPQEMIDAAQYGKWAGHPVLGPAEYQLTYQYRESKRGVYTFCMCPGGMVIGASSEPNGVVTNGMSYLARNSGVANSAVVVTVNWQDYGNESPLAGMSFQQRLEQRAFEVGGSNYFAPVQRLADFLKRQPSFKFSALPPSYLPGTTAANLWEVLPAPICQAISDGIKYFGSKLKGFDWADAVLTGVETRTSAPVRILRNELREAIGVRGIYPVGEGAGYAGGIISSALDGWRTAEQIINE
jgi:uncharacterized FAD-dependent dehydrogenase